MHYYILKECNCEEGKILKDMACYDGNLLEKESFDERSPRYDLKNHFEMTIEQ